MATKRIIKPTFGETLATRQRKAKFRATMGEVTHKVAKGIAIFTALSLMSYAIYGLGRLTDKRCGYKASSIKDKAAVAEFFKPKIPKLMAQRVQAESLKR